VRSFDGEIDPNPAGSGSIGHRLVEVALAYDLCYDAWPEAFRSQVAEGLLARVQYRQRRLHPGHANYHPCSNYYGPSHGSSGLAALAIWGEKGPAPVEPAAPLEVLQESVEIAPAADYQPGRGVPVLKFQSGIMPSEWMFVGGFKPQAGEDTLNALGGPAAARPELGTKVTFGGRSETFRLIPHEEDKGYWSSPQWTDDRTSIDITGAVNREYHTTNFFYTVIDNDRPRWVRVGTEWDPAVVYLAGVELRHGSVVHLEKGLYPVMVVAAIGETQPWGRIFMEPRLIELPPELAQRRLADRRADYRLDHDVWQADRDFWQRTGGIDPIKQRYFGFAHQRVLWHYRLGIGHGGFQAETGVYAQIGSWYPLVYATAYQKMFGRDASPRPDITHLMPRRAMQVLFCEDGTTEAQKINSVVGFDPSWCAAAFPITGLRALAFDYSGLSGAPCLIVLVDKIRGGKQRLWTWQLSEEMVEKVQVDGNTFTLDYGDASLKATFVAPRDIELQAATEMVQVADPRHGFHGQISRVKAAADGNEPGFLVVMTIQRGAPAAVEVRGSGLEAAIGVGRRTVRFDGEKVVLEGP